MASQPTAVQGAVEVVPWKSVGPGWVLVEHGTGTLDKPAPMTLDLVSPTGAKYALHTFPAQTYGNWLVAWSGDKTHALFKIGTTNTYQQWNLQTGKVISEFTLPKGTASVSYTSPTGQELIGVVNTLTKTTETSTVERFNLAGQVVKILASEASSTIDPFPLQPAQSADGKTVALGYSGGLEVVSNAGGAVQRLPVPGTNPRLGCYVARWWDSGTVLAVCSGQLSFRLWLVPTGGAEPTALTPVRTATSGSSGLSVM